MVSSEPTIVDLSKWQGNIDWSQAYQSIDLAILRVSYGTDTKIEPKYKSYADSCAEYGVPFGAYSYCLYKTKAAAQKEAAAFYKQATSDGRAPLFFVIDIEESFIKKSHTEAYITKLRELAAADGVTRLKIGVYIGHHLYAKLKLDLTPDLDDPTTPDFVWIPRYNLPNNGAMKATAKIPDYPCDLWQYSSGAYLPGVTGKVDVNTLYDTEGDPLSDTPGFSFDWLVAGAEAAA
jgi:GH25 family lysozyme M1 (1,4-beta-N-acetylmuramidase)